VSNQTINNAGKALGLPPPCSLYVHIPWCVKKCPYCDFNSHEASPTLPEQAYLTQLLIDLQQDLDYFRQQRPVCALRSVFFGGGTPSLLSAEVFAEIIRITNNTAGFSDCVEITLEANPGTVNREKMAALKGAGINRLSIGVQSFLPSQLKTLGRIHDSKDACNAFHWARECGFSNINLDLMFGLPRQTLSGALQDLSRAIELAPEHISWYQLTIEPNTQFYRTPPQLPQQDLIWEMHQQGISLLEQAGYEQYEVSAFARANRVSQHNLNYWQFGDYIAIGAGAHGKCTNTSNGNISRYWKTRLPQHYLSRIGNLRAGQETIAREQIPFEFLMNALRLRQGVTEADYPRATGLDLASLEPQLSKLREQGLLVRDRLQCTDLGYLHLNSVLSGFIVD